jgi:hypothetical protein
MHAGGMQEKKPTVISWHQKTISVPKGAEKERDYNFILFHYSFDQKKGRKK